MRQINPLQPLVSVIIPTHRRVEMLKRAIESVLSQSYSNLELIVVDDFSNDGTIDFLKSIEDERLKFHSNKESKGANYSRNIGLKKATGNYIALLDDDDEWLQKKVEKQMELLMTDDQIIGVSCSYKIKNKHNPEMEEEIKKDLTVDFNKLLEQNYVGSCSFFIFKNQKDVLFDESLSSCQDWDFYLQLTQKTKLKIRILPNCLVNYTIHGNQITSSGESYISGVNSFMEKWKSHLGFNTYFHFKYHNFRMNLRDSLNEKLGNKGFNLLRNYYKKFTNKKP